jgi:hypothetical protein
VVLSRDAVVAAAGEHGARAAVDVREQRELVRSVERTKRPETYIVVRSTPKTLSASPGRPSLATPS